MSSPSILFCSDPFDLKQVDPDYTAEYAAAKAAGFSVFLFNYDALTQNEQGFLRGMLPQAEPIEVIYRGWMLKPEQYRVLYDGLLEKNYRLINTPEHYRNCHYLPESLRFIEGRTPHTVFEPFTDDKSIERLLEKAVVFGDCPVILKDYVKSEKHDWEEACFVPDVSDTGKLKRAIEKLLELRGSFLNEGIVIREFVPLNALTVHSKSGMPLTEEYRLFFFDGKLLGTWDYWEEGNYDFPKPDTAEFETLAQQIDSRFFTMDIARRQTGEWIIIELGDGQVSGLPEKLAPLEFYGKLSL